MWEQSTLASRHEHAPGGDTLYMEELTSLHIMLADFYLVLSVQSIRFKSSADWIRLCPSYDPTTNTPLRLQAIKSRGTIVQCIKHLWSKAIPLTELSQRNSDNPRYVKKPLGSSNHFMQWISHSLWFSVSVTWLLLQKFENRWFLPCDIACIKHSKTVLFNYVD